MCFVAVNTEKKKQWDIIMRTANQNADNVSDEEECEGKDVETLCEELAHFTPQLCDNDVAKEKCTVWRWENISRYKTNLFRN